jgi:hypothetical protein
MLRGSTVAQHFDPRQGQRGYGVEVDRHVATADAVARVEIGRGMAAFAVDQHQQFARPQAT